jgi:ubiquinol-cytochrome c reductase subunit 8
MFKGYLFNGVRRLSAQAPYWAVPFAVGKLFCSHDAPVSTINDYIFSILGYGIYAWAKSYDRWQNSKEGHLAGAGGH